MTALISVDGGKGAIPKVVDPKVDDTSDSTITISWSKPADHDNITAYRITCTAKDKPTDESNDIGTKDSQTEDTGEVLQSPANQEVTIDDPEATSVTFSSDLYPGKAYVFQLFCVCGKHEGDGVELEAVTSKMI